MGCCLALSEALIGGTGELRLSTDLVQKAFRDQNPVLPLPLTSGSWRNFRFERTAFVPESASHAVRTFRGWAIDGSRASAQVVLTPQSLSAQIFLDGAIIYVDSAEEVGGQLMLLVDAGRLRGEVDFHCGTEFGSPLPSELNKHGELRKQNFGHVLRKFRLAPAATAEFTEFHGSKEEAVRQVVTAMNRASGIFHRELGISFELVPGFDRMIFTDKDSDPYSTNEPTEKMLQEAQAAFDGMIGSANYDLGIVLTRGTYGLAYLRSVCDPARKGSSCIGLPEPVGDAFHVNLVTHELGHQFGASHTFNSPTGLCSERRNGWTAYEPGAGSTIMSYASLPCGGDSFQPRNDAYFHSESLKEIMEYVNSAAVSCAEITATENLPPQVSAGGAFIIPVGTPFALTASGADPDGDQLTYCWEERDLGPAQELGAGDNGSSPLFRSYPPAASPTRMFPALEEILAGGDSPEARLPRTGRTLRFRVTARDSKEHGAFAWSDTQVGVVDNAGPFHITSHGVPSRLSGTTRVQWNAGGTTEPPISATTVRISLSTDGGRSFPIVLAEATANDGSEDVALPEIRAENVRLKVEPTNNIFFDINDATLTIEGATELRLQVDAPGNGFFQISWPSVSGTSYRLEKAETLPQVRWNEMLRTNASQSVVSVILPADDVAGFFRIVQE